MAVENKQIIFALWPILENDENDLAVLNSIQI